MCRERRKRCSERVRKASFRGVLTKPLDLEALEKFLNGYDRFFFMDHANNKTHVNEALASTQV